MERRRGATWGCPGRRRSSWPAALLAATILSSGFEPTRAQEIPVTAEPAKPLEGQDVTLTLGGKLTFIVCNWYRGEQAEANRILTYIPSLSPPQQVNGPAFTGRETGGPGCSLHIRSLILNDTGVYVVSKAIMDGRERGRVQIGVSESPSRSDPSKAISAIVLGSLAVAALAGTLLYCFFRARRQKNKSSREMNPTSPVYENTGPSAQVVPVNSSEINNTMRTCNMEAGTCTIS